MKSRSGPVRRLRQEDSDSDTNMENQVSNNVPADETQKMRDLTAIAMEDLGSHTREWITTSDKTTSRHNRRLLQSIYSDRAVNQEGTPEQAQFLKHKAATNAWNNSGIIGDSSEETLANLDNGQSHRIGLKEKYGEIKDYDGDLEYGGRGGFRGSGRGRGGGEMGRGGRRGGSFRSSPLRLSSLAVRGGGSGIIRGSVVSRGGSTSTTYRPKDPAVDPDTPYGYGKDRKRPSTRGTSNNFGVSGGRCQPTPVKVSTAPHHAERLRERITQSPSFILAPPSQFMDAVGRKNTREESVASRTAVEEAKTGVESQKAPLFKPIDSKWGETKTSNNVTQSSAKHDPGTSDLLIQQSIRQVPTKEFVFPHPHRGDTESWTDGVPSPQSSVGIDSPSAASQHSDKDPIFPPINNGLGIIINDNLMDTNSDEDEDRKALEEPVIDPQQMIQQRIFVDGHWYVLDRSASSNAPSRLQVNIPAIAEKAKLVPTSVQSERVGVSSQTTPRLPSSSFTFSSPLNPFAERKFAAVISKKSSIETLPRSTTNNISTNVVATKAAKSRNLADSIWGVPNREVVTNAKPVLPFDATPAPVIKPADFRDVAMPDILPITCDQVALAVAMNGTNSEIISSGGGGSSKPSNIRTGRRATDLNASKYAHGGMTFSPSKKSFDILTSKDENSNSRQTASPLFGDSRNIKKGSTTAPSQIPASDGIARGNVGVDYFALCEELAKANGLDDSDYVDL